MSGNEPYQLTEADFVDWRGPLLKSLRSCGVQSAPRYPVLRYIVAIVTGLLTGLFVIIVDHILPEPRIRSDLVALYVCHGLLYLFSVFVLYRIRNRFLRQAWMSSARSATDEIRRSGSRRPILYLRSFALDQKLNRRTWLEFFMGTFPLASSEQEITIALRKLGPVIAIGRPGETLPSLGAARFYVSDELWQQKVLDVLKCSQLVVWASGVTEGLRWEITHLTNNLNPRQLILWAHPHLLGISAKQREQEWTRFRQTLGRVFPKPLPAILGNARFFVFDADWTPHAVVPPKMALFTGYQRATLERALRLQQHGFDEIEAKPSDSPRIRTDLGTLIGARGPRVRWPLVGMFFVTLFITMLVNDVVWSTVDSGIQEILLSLTYWMSHLARVAISCAAVVAALRFLSKSWRAALAIAVVLAPLDLILPNVLKGQEIPMNVCVLLAFGLSFLRNLALFGLLIWAVGRNSRMFVGLGLGIFLGELVHFWLYVYSFGVVRREGDITLPFVMENGLHATGEFFYFLPYGLIFALIKANVFAAIYWLALRTFSYFGGKLSRQAPQL